MGSSPQGGARRPRAGAALDENCPLYHRPGAPGVLTDMGCPDCRGVLSVNSEGDGGFLIFTCRIGHSFSSESLVAAKEEQLETALWTSVELYEEIELLHRELLRHAEATGQKERAVACAERADRAARLASDIRELIARDGPAKPAGGRVEPAGA